MGQEGAGHGAGLVLLGLPSVPAAGGSAGGEDWRQVVLRGCHVGRGTRHAADARRGHLQLPGPDGAAHSAGGCLGQFT